MDPSDVSTSSGPLFNYTSRSLQGTFTPITHNPYPYAHEIRAIEYNYGYLKDEYWQPTYSDKAEYFLVVLTLVSLLGLVGNVLIIRTFLKMGLTDSVTIMLFNIAVSELNYVTATLVVCVCRICEYAPEDVFWSYKLHPHSIETICEHSVMLMTISVNVFSTTFVAVQRCLCVIKPLHFRETFTRRRTLIVVGLIWVIGLHQLVLWFLWSEVREERLRENKGAWLTLVLNPTSKWNEFAKYMNIITSFVEGVCQVVIVIAIVVMCRELVRSVQFRSKYASNNKTVGTHSDGGRRVGGGGGGGRTHDSDSNNEKQYNVVTSDKTTVSSTNSKTAKMGLKERRVTIQVSLVATVFMATHSHQLFFAIAYAVPSVTKFFMDNFHYLDLYGDITRTLNLMSASVNVFIYYAYNTKFKQLCFKL